MIYLPDTNACITLLRQRHPRLRARWRAAKASDEVLLFHRCLRAALRSGAQPDPVREHGKLDVFLGPFASLPFDDDCGRECARIRRELERIGAVIGPLDLQIAAIAYRHKLTLVTHNTREFSRVHGLSLEDWEV